MRPTLRFFPTITDYAARWMFIGIAGLVSAISLRLMGVAVPFDTLWSRVEFIGTLLAFGMAYSLVGKWMPRLARPSAMVSDLLLSVGQLSALVIALLPLTYLAAAPALPLLDADLARLDLHLFGFQWDSAARWVASRPVLDFILQQAYFSMLYQAGAVLLIGSISQPGGRNRDFIWQTATCLLLTCAIFVFTPALGTIGHTGNGPVEALTAIRNGHWTVLDYSRAEGIIAFPSFHTALGILFVWAVRTHPWMLALFAPINLLLIAATPTVGGHHLIDLLGGAVVAAISICATHAVLYRLNHGRRGRFEVPAASGIEGIQPAATGLH